MDRVLRAGLAAALAAPAAPALVQFDDTRRLLWISDAPAGDPCTMDQVLAVSRRQVRSLITAARNASSARSRTWVCTARPLQENPCVHAPLPP